jgi:transposase-like protein
MDGVGDGTSSHFSRRRKDSPEVRARFLDALREMPLVNRAARAAGVSARTCYDWRQADPEFRAAWAAALDEGIERIEEVTHRAALDDGSREGTLQRMFTLKRWRPEYRDNVTHHHRGGGQDARDAALLRRAMVEALGPYPEARAALASHLARLAAGREDETSSSGVGGELPAAATSPPPAIERVDAGAGGAGAPAASGGPVQAASTSTIPQEKGPILDVEYEVVSGDEGSGDND